MKSDNISKTREGSDFKRIAELLSASREGTRFSLKSKTELNELLRCREANREYAAQYLLDGESLKELLASKAISELTTGRSPKPVTQFGDNGSLMKWMPILAMAATVALSGVLVFTWLTRTPIALIQDEANAVFAEDMSPREGILGRGVYSLLSGMIAVEFRNGVTMTVKAPADFEIMDALRVRLNRGSIRASAPDSGYGFVIETPEVDIQDLGTEFGVTVDGQSGDSEVHVFDGEVSVNKHRAQETIASLEMGDSATILDGQVNLGHTPEQNFYLTPADVSYSRWLSMSNELRNDGDALFYYSFSSPVDEPLTLKDESVHSAVIDGMIEGARWVTGRWPGKRALLFDQPNDAVEIDIPGELKQFTFGAWVNMDRMDAPVTSILNSLDYKAGALHLQVSRSGNGFVPAVYPRVRKERTDVSMPTGKWVLLTAVIDVDKKVGRTWINGQRAVTGRFDDSTFVKPGICLLGAYRTELEGKRTKEFRGRMDEVFLLKRALTQGEIRRIYKNGRPNAQLETDT